MACLAAGFLDGNPMQIKLLDDSPGVNMSELMHRQPQGEVGAISEHRQFAGKPIRRRARLFWGFPMFVVFALAIRYPPAYRRPQLHDRGELAQRRNGPLQILTEPIPTE